MTQMKGTLTSNTHLHMPSKLLFPKFIYKGAGSLFAKTQKRVDEWSCF